MNFDNPRVPRLYHNNARLQQKIANDLVSFALYNLKLRNLNHFNNIKAILDIGCGTGFVTDCVARHFPASVVVGQDTSNAMIEYCRSNFFTTYSNATFTNEDFDVALKSREFNMAISSFALHWVDDLPSVLDAIMSRCEYFALALPLDGSFCDIKQLCKMYDVKTCFYPLPSLWDLCHTFSRYKVNMYDCIYRERFEDIISLLKYLRSIGAGIVQQDVSILDIKRFINVMLGNSVNLQYHALFCFFEKY